MVNTKLGFPIVKCGNTVEIVLLVFEIWVYENLWPALWRIIVYIFIASALLQTNYTAIGGWINFH